MPDAVHDLASFKEFLSDRARVTWEERGIPYYLSFVATDLKRQNVDYHDFTGPLRLVQWVTGESIPGAKLVSHPTAKAKVGLVPEDVDYVFPDEADGVPSTSKARSTKRELALVSFVESLAALPADVLEEYQVPAKVLLGFLKR